MAKTHGSVHKRSLLAHDDLDRLGVQALENLLETRALALKAFKDMRGYSDKSDAGVGYLGLVLRADLEIVALKYAKMSALAIKDMTDRSEAKQPLNTAQAIKVLQNDPFCSPELKEIPTEKILDAMESKIKTPFLPAGDGNAKPD